MSGLSAKHDQFAKLPGQAGAAGAAAADTSKHAVRHGSVMFAAAPDSGHFQHFMDRTALMLVQAERLRTSSTKYIALQPV